MSVSLYTERCETLAQELVDTLSESEIDGLRDRLRGLTTSQWLEWCAQNKEIAAFVAATPAQRRRKKAWKKTYAALTLAGFQHCLGAHAMLKAIDRYFLEPGGSYRDMAARAGAAYLSVRDAHDLPWLWPWPGESPWPGHSPADEDE